MFFEFALTDKVGEFARPNTALERCIFEVAYFGVEKLFTHGEPPTHARRTPSSRTANPQRIQRQPQQLLCGLRGGQVAQYITNFVGAIAKAG